jgi:hypothetical protein
MPQNHVPSTIHQYINTIHVYAIREVNVRFVDKASLMRRGWIATLIDSLIGTYESGIITKNFQKNAFETKIFEKSFRVLGINPDDLNADSPIWTSFQSFSIISDSSHLHFLKHDLQKISIDAGIAIDFSPDPKNNSSSIRINFESASNVIDSSDSQYWKHNLPRISTNDGIVIDFNRDDLNADSSIRINFESLANIIDSRRLHPSKHPPQRTSTDHGITIDFNPELQNATHSVWINFESSSNRTDLSEYRVSGWKLASDFLAVFGYIQEWQNAGHMT